ncbi:MAG: right-handed parallel beta-helix repeat-containing protein [Xanthobacteraceae bacterium]
MRNIVFLRVLLFAGLASVLASILPTTAQAGLTTWVSGTGNDSNSSSGCQVTAPCRSLGTAISETTAGGTVFCAGTTGSALVIGSSLTIAQDVTIDCSQGTLASPASCNGGNGIIINAGVKVTLRGLTIYSVDPPSCFPGDIGVNITAAASVRIENCKIFGFSSAGIVVAPSSGLAVVKIQDSTITQNGSGVLVTPTGTGNVSISIDRSRVESNNGGGVKTTTATTSGQINASISDSSVSFNSGNGLNVVSGSGAPNTVALTRDIIALNGVSGVQANGGTSAALIDTTLLDSNVNALEAVGGGRILTYGNNRIIGSAGTGFTSTTPLQ